MRHILCFLVSITPGFSCHTQTDLKIIVDHGQGGAQGMEDGLALGLTMHGVTHSSQIEARLAIYEKIRRGRAASIQVMSNFGIDEEKPKELATYLEGRPLPS